MKRANRIAASLRLVVTQSFLLPSHISPARYLHSQVTRYYYYYSHLSSPFSQKAHYCKYDFLNPHHQQKFYISSITKNSVIELIKTNKWSEDSMKELEKLHPTTLSHETVIYVLKILDENPEKALDFFNWVCDKNGFKPSLMAYSLMLRILANEKTIKEFWVLIKKMSEEGCHVDEETYSTINLKSEATALKEFYTKMTQEGVTYGTVKGIVDVVLESDWNDNVEKKLGELKDTLSENTILRIFRGLRVYPLKALLFFRWLEEHMGYIHSAVTYNSILRVLGQEESIKEFWSMVNEMKSLGHDIDIDTFIKISRQLQKNGMMKDAVELYELMMDSPYKPTVVTCSSLLRHISLTETPDIDLVFRVVKKYEATGHTPSKTVYRQILRSLTSVGRCDEVEKVLKRMRNAGYKQDNITYNHVVSGLCNAGRLEEACKMFDEMEAQGCVPDIKTWTILIQGHCSAGEIDQAMKCYTLMLEKNLEADADLLEVLVDGLCRERRLDSAYTLLIEMVDKTNLKPYFATYKGLIQNLLGERKLEQAMNLLHMTVKIYNFTLFTESFGDYISKFGAVDDAIEFLEALRVKKYPSSSVYLHILQSFCKEGRQSDARDLLYKCPRHIRNHADILNLFASLRPTDATA